MQAHNYMLAIPEARVGPKRAVSGKELDAHRRRIEILYHKHPLKKVQEILEEGGIFAR
jgi:hypothetical protein